MEAHNILPCDRVCPCLDHWFGIVLLRCDKICPCPNHQLDGSGLTIFIGDNTGELCRK